MLREQLDNDDIDYGVGRGMNARRALHPAARFFSSQGRNIIIGMLAIALTICIIGVIALISEINDLKAAQPKVKIPKNIILMVSDGTGATSMTFARNWKNPAAKLPLDEILVGTSATYASDSLVTDSAAGATAFSCALKTYNAAIGMKDTQPRQPCGTILEAAWQQRNKLTGLVATTRITHATPAAFSAHVVHRDMEADIAAQQVTKGINVILAGGLQYYLPQSAAGSKRTDDQDLIAYARSKGMSIVTGPGRAAFDAIDPIAFKPSAAAAAADLTNRKQLLGLLALDSLAYEIDRDPLQEPSLAEMTQKALDVLTQMQSGMPDGGPGFLLMVEGSKIDWAAHSNDAAAHLHDLLAYNDAVTTVMKFANASKDTLVISTSDHETGGLTLGEELDGVSLYQWNPRVLDTVRASTQVIAATVLTAMQNATTNEQQPEIIKSTIARLSGLTDITQAEYDAAVAIAMGAGNFNERGLALMLNVGNMINRRVRLGWTTKAHTGPDVNLYASGPGFEAFRGQHQNTDVGAIIASYWSIDLAAVNTSRVY